MPKVSVIMPSYNHERFVGHAIQSVLDQTFQDFEIVITDDGSTDGTVGEIKKFADPRVRLFTFEQNQGAAAAANNCIANAAGEYFAVLNSDDIFLPEKLEKQVRFLDGHPDVAAVFSYARIIDEENNDFTDEKHFYAHIFEQHNRTRFEWLNRFFYEGNCLCHPSVLIRRKCYEEIGLYDTRLAQLPDFDLWIRLCLKHEIYVIPEKLIKFRVLSGQANASGGGVEGVKRHAFELKCVLKNFLNIKKTDELLRILPEASRFGDELDDGLTHFYIAMLALDVKAKYPAYQDVALDVLYQLLENKKTVGRLEEKYGFNQADFHKLSGGYDSYSRSRSDAEHAKKDKELKQRKTLIEQKDKELEQRKTLVEQKDKELEQSGRMLKQKDAELEQSGRMLKQKDTELNRDMARINALENSLSWKITAPLRKVAKLLK